MALPKLPMKAPSQIVPFESLRYPMLASTKYDGFRMISLCGESFISPNLKEIPNQDIPRRWESLWSLAKANRLVLDGEVWSSERTFQSLQSIIRSHATPIPNDVNYHVFDVLLEDEWNEIIPVDEYILRYNNGVMQLGNHSGLVQVPQYSVSNAHIAQATFERAIGSNLEGLILRAPYFGYKHGRCTIGEMGMFKFKQFETYDATIIGVEQRRCMRDGLERTVDVVGHLERVLTQDSFTFDQAVGAFIVTWQGVNFKVTPGRGFTYQDRRDWWQQHLTDPNHFIGQTIEFKYMPHGTKDKPRIGSLVRFRPDKIAELAAKCLHCGVVHHTPLALCECECCEKTRQQETEAL